jgi:hypothetical protein
MNRNAREPLDISINLSKLLDVEIRDERGITKVVIPIDVNNISLTEYGSAIMNLVAFPVKKSVFGATHAIKQHLPKHMRHKASRLIMGSVYPHGNFDYKDDLTASRRSQQVEKAKEKERKQKYKGLDF